MTDKGRPAPIPATGVGAAIYVDSVKAMAESVGISNMQDEAAKELAEDITYRLRHILQDAVKFMEKGKRSKLSTEDFDNALKVKNMEVSFLSWPHKARWSRKSGTHSNMILNSNAKVLNLLYFSSSYSQFMGRAKRIFRFDMFPAEDESFTSLKKRKLTLWSSSTLRYLKSHWTSR